MKNFEFPIYIVEFCESNYECSPSTAIGCYPTYEEAKAFAESYYKELSYPSGDELLSINKVREFGKMVLYEEGDTCTSEIMAYWKPDKGWTEFLDK